MATRDLLIATAERLYAERGVHAVSNRQISEAAGQGNNTAVSYHFGSKADLVRAILAKHSTEIEQIRARLITEVVDPDDLREWVQVAVRSVTEHLANLGRPSWYARFLAQVAADPTLHNLDEADALDAAPSLRTLRDGMTRTLPVLPEEILNARSAMTRHLIYQATVDRERLPADDATSSSWDEIANEVIDAVVAVWCAPVGTESLPGTLPAPATGTIRDHRPTSPARPEENSKALPDREMVAFARELRPALAQALMEYRFAADALHTRVAALREEARLRHGHDPIEHVTSRIKSPTRILDKAIRKGAGPTLASIRERVTDIAGIRITSGFVDDAYRILDALTSQADLRVIETKDYIASPKANGYRSLHALCEVPVHLSTGTVLVSVEVQIRTVAMDFWADLEHAIFSRHTGDVPSQVVADLAAAARAAEELDERTKRLYAQARGPMDRAGAEAAPGIDDEVLERFWQSSTGRPT